MRPARAIGQPTKITAEDEDRMVKVILLMREMQMPTYKHFVVKIFKAMFKGGKYTEMFPKGVTYSWYELFFVCHSY